MKTVRYLQALSAVCCLSAVVIAQADTSNTTGAPVTHISAPTAPEKMNASGAPASTGAIDVKSDPNCVCKKGETVGLVVKAGTAADPSAKPKIPCRCESKAVHTPAAPR